MKFEMINLQPNMIEPAATMGIYQDTCWGCVSGWCFQSWRAGKSKEIELKWRLYWDFPANRGLTAGGKFAIKPSDNFTDCELENHHF